MSEAKPWAFVAHKDNHLGGVTIADKDAGKFLSGFIRRGYTITTVFSRAEYNALIAPLLAAKAKP